jgi:holo-[acyl-carrier protein] synthase
VIEVERIESALARFGARFERRIFSRGEIAACRRHRRPALQYALRFAAKEALMKAVGTGWSQGVRWIDIETAARSRSGEALGLVLHGRVAELAGRRGRYRTHLAVARSRRLALAAVLFEADSE